MAGHGGFGLGITSTYYKPVTQNPSFKTFSYGGNGGTMAFTQPGFQPDMIITAALAANGIQTPTTDSVNGAGKFFNISSNAGLITDLSGVLSFDPTGYTIGPSTRYNSSSALYQSFCWRNSPQFNVIGYTGTGVNRTISHSLGTVPQMIWIVDLTLNQVVSMYHIGMDATSPQNYVIVWNSLLVTRVSGPTYWNNTAPTSSVFSLGTSSDVNNSGTSGYTAYLFGAQAGFSAFGTYTGNGSSLGPSVTGLGFNPSLVMICKQSASNNNIWLCYGNNANTKLNVTNTAEDTSNYIDLIPGGFSLKTSADDFNTNTATYFYSAWL